MANRLERHNASRSPIRDRMPPRGLFGIEPVFVAFVIGFGGTTLAPGQSSFQNLDFESASLAPIPDDPYQRVYLDLAIPHWAGYTGTNQLNGVLHDNTFLSSSGISILDSGNTVFPGPAIRGSFSVFLQAGVELGSSNPADTSLAQARRDRQ